MRIPILMSPVALAMAILSSILLQPTSAQVIGKDWAPLFNGTDLAGWDTWLGKEYGAKGKPAGEIVGLNKDPRKVFTVVELDGKPAIRISGETNGGLVSKDEFDNYHLKLQFKWGEKKWPPAEKARRNSGVLYRSVGPHGAHDNSWMCSLEFQIQEGNTGDWWTIAGSMVDVEAERKAKNIVFKQGGQKMTVPTDDKVSRIIKNPDNERPTGQWNDIELICLGPVSMHVVNGKVNMVLSNARHKVGDKFIPMTKGKIQLQSEGAEIFFRDIKLKAITRLPDEYNASLPKAHTRP
jgi:Domain of Unknown Function (DUF1080)